MGYINLLVRTQTNDCITFVLNDLKMHATLILMRHQREDQDIFKSCSEEVTVKFFHSTPLEPYLITITNSFGKTLHTDLSLRKKFVFLVCLYAKEFMHSQSLQVQSFCRVNSCPTLSHVFIIAKNRSKYGINNGYGESKLKNSVSCYLSINYMF